MKRWQKISIGIASFALLGAAFTAFILPAIVKSKALATVKEKTGRTLAIGRIDINPFNWSVKVSNIKLTEKGSDAVFFSCSSVRTRVSPRSIWHRAPVVATVDIVSPSVKIVRTGPNDFNFSDLLSKDKDKKPVKDEKPARFSINNIWLKNGSIDFIDQVPTTEKHHTVRNMELKVPFVSNLPYLADKYIDPSFSAVINNAPFSLLGKMKPFAKEVTVSLDIKLKDLDIPFYAAYFPTTLPVRIPSGTVTTDLELTHRAVKSGKPEVGLSGLIRLTALKLQDRAGSPLLGLPEASVHITSAKIMSQEFSLASIYLKGLEAFLSRDSRGVWSFTKLMPPPGPEKKEKAPLPAITVAKASLEGGMFHFNDGLPPGGFRTDLKDINLELTDISTIAGKTGAYKLALASNRKESVKAEGNVIITPMKATSHVVCTDIPLEAYYPYLATVLTAPVAGKLSAESDVIFSATDGLKAEKASAKLQNLLVPFGKNEGVKIPRIAATGGSVDLKTQSALLDSVTIDGGSVALSRAATGELSPMSLLKSKTPAATPHKQPAGKPFSYQLKRVAINGTDLIFTDHQKQRSPTFTLNKATISLANISGPTMKTMPFRFASGFNKKGSIKSAGNVAVTPLNLKGSCTLQRIPISDFDAYFPEDLNVVIADGTLDTTMAFSINKAADGLAGTFSGGVGIRSFHSVDGDQGDDLLKWESLQLDNLSGTLQPFSLKLAEVALNNFYARVIINKDGSLNLQKLRTPKQSDAQAAKEPAKAVAPPAPAPVPADAPKKTIIIDAITMQDGTLSFTDHHMNPEYATTMLNLGGRVSGLSSDEAKFADVDLRGNLENHSPLRITGTINPLRDDLFVDLKVSFTDIELSPLTPYSGTYLGYSIDKGKLFLDLKYRIEKKKLESENKIFIDQFTFGKKIESEKATHMPVSLGIALLKDRKGEIHLDVPVTGRTDDPKFSIWRLVFQVLRNLMVKAVTSPFALMQSMFSGKEDFSTVTFAPGSADLSEQEKQKLVKFSQFLNDRPGLKLEVGGFVDRERDPEGYRNEQLMKKMKNEKFLALVKAKGNQQGQSAETMTIEPQEYSALLKAVYLKEKFPKPRNFLGMVKDIPDNEMKKLIFANTVVGDQEFHTLARERTQSVRNFLVAEGKIPPERVFEKSGEIFTKPEKEGVAISRVEFGLAAK